MAHGTESAYQVMTPAETGKTRLWFCAPHMTGLGSPNQISFDGGAQNEIHSRSNGNHDVPDFPRLDSGSPIGRGGAAGGAVMAKKSTLDIMHDAICYCRMRGDEQAALIIDMKM